MRPLVAALVGSALVFGPALASAATLQVGPTRTYKTLAAVASIVNPGDVVEVDGGSTYAAVTFNRAGTAAAKITIRGIKAAGKRPILSGGTNTVELAGDHYVFEGFEVTGGSARCVYHHADDVTVRDSVIHDCPAHGLLGADQGSGSLVLEYTEVYKCGNGTQNHQIYMATDEVAHPGAVFRMQFCWVHDGNGGNNVKTRAERNEIYYNWIEGALYHELELIGPDPGGAPSGWSEALKREDSDVVGNVLHKRSGSGSFVRLGGDGTGQSWGRFRFVNNTLISEIDTTAFRFFQGVQSVEMHNNVLFGTGSSVIRATRIVTAAPAEMTWASGEQIAGTNNWVQSSTTFIPTQWTGTIYGATPGIHATDYTVNAGSPLIDKGAGTTAGPAGYAFPSPLAKPLFHPPAHALLAPGAATARPAAGAIDIGAYEYGATTPTDAGPADTGVTVPDTGVTDTGVIVTDSGVVVTDTGVIVTDSGVIVTDTGVIVADGGGSDTDPAPVDSGVVGTGDAGSDGGIDVPSAENTDVEGSCGCRCPGTVRPIPWLLLLTAVGALALRLRRRR